MLPRIRKYVSMPQDILGALSRDVPLYYPFVMFPSTYPRATVYLDTKTLSKVHANVLPP